MAQTIKIRRGGIGAIGASSPATLKGELILATGSLTNGLGTSLFAAEEDNTLRLTHGRIDTISDGPALQSELNASFTGLLIHSASDNKLYRYDGSVFQELPIAAGSFVGTLPVSSGGTNATSFADKAVIISQDSGTDTLSGLALTTNGALVIGGSSGPAAATLTAGAGIDINNSDGGIEIVGETASDSNAGIVELATNSETVTGTSTALAVTPAGVSASIAANGPGYLTSVPNATTSTAGIVELATTAETTTGTDATRAVTPDGLKDGYQGSTNVTTLGTITTGTWQGSAISTTYIQNTSGTNTGDEPDATTSVKGIIEIATNAEAVTGTSTTLAVTPAGVSASIAANGPGYFNAASDISLGGDLSGTADNATVAKVQGIALTSDEATQLANINTTSISATQWGYLGVMDQNVRTTDAVSFATVNTGQGANELYAMDQNVQTSDSPSFAGVTGGNIKVGVTGDNEIDTTSGNLTIDSAGGTTTIDDHVIIAGNLTVNGDTVQTNVGTLNVEDNTITVNYGGAAANAGILAIDNTATTAGTGSLQWNGANNYWMGGFEGSEKRIVLQDANMTNNSFVIATGAGTINDVEVSTAGDILQWNGSSMVASNVIDGGTF